MPGLLPAAVYGLQVPCGDLIVPASDDPSPVSFRITMAAIDPTAAPEFSGSSVDAPVRATLKLIREPLVADSDDNSDDEDEDDYLGNMLKGGRSGDDEDDESSSDDDDDDEKNGGPSDPAKSKKARREAAIEKMIEAIGKDDSDEEMEDGSDKPNGISPKVKKGKAKVVNGTTMDEDGLDEEDDYEEFVLCTLDPEKHYQQPLDITVGEHEQVFFKVSGTHAVYLTGNYVVPIDDSHRHEGSDSEDDEDEDYVVGADGIYDDEESDELDDMEDPRITELGSEDEAEAVPALVKPEPASKKGKNKRTAEDSELAGLDDIMAKSLKPEVPATNGEPKLSKKQLKKLKNNAGKAVDATAPATNGVKADEKALKDAKIDSAEAKDKKVTFAKNLEQGPSGTAGPSAAENEKTADIKKDAEKLKKPTLGVKTVQGVKIDDKKLGSGSACKNGNKVSMRYIGKLTDGKVFDANKKGTPFSFTLGRSEVIKGWDIGVAGMSIGGERRITIPPHLAYGSQAKPGIPANSQLIFEVKLLEIK